jgi:hypothetical protein
LWPERFCDQSAKGSKWFDAIGAEKVHTTGGVIYENASKHDFVIAGHSRLKDGVASARLCRQSIP